MAQHGVGASTQIQLTQPLTGGRVFSELDQIDKIPPTIERLFHIFHGRIPPNDREIILAAPAPPQVEDALNPFEWYTRTQLDEVTQNLISEDRYVTAIRKDLLLFRQEEGIFYFEAATYCKWYRIYVYPEIRYQGPSLEYMMAQLQRLKLYGISEFTGELTENRIKDIAYTGKSPCWKVTYAIYTEGKQPRPALAPALLLSTHKVHTGNGFVPLLDLKIGSWVSAIGSYPTRRYKTVACIGKIEPAGLQETYTLEVDSIDTHNYEVYGGLVVHNGKGH